MNGDHKSADVGSARRMRLHLLGAIVVGVLPGLHGCGLMTPMTFASMSSTVIGGLAKGAVMGGSVIGTIREQVAGGRKDTDTGADTPPSAVETADSGEPLISSAPYSAAP
ncbi:MAG: hypothetical protein JWN94_3872 [Betaproteobacteria bacterium]|nr:hypothetical protein [Betaproteobacteria bacterium]